MIPLLGAFEPSDDILAVDDSEVVLTRADVRSECLRWRDLSQGQKRLVLLLGENTSADLGSYLALIAAGHAVILMAAGSSEATVDDVVRRYRPWMIVRPGKANELTGVEPPPLHPDLGVLLSTSGSTGSPKLARFSVKQLEANADAIVDYLGIDAAERPLAHLPFNYSFGLSVVHSHLRAGATLLLTRASMMSSEFWARMAEDKATSFSGVPFHFEMLLKLRFQRKDLPHLKTLAQAGGKLAPDLVLKVADAAEATGRRFFVMYGQTEAGPRITYMPPDQVRKKPGSIGRAIPGVQLSLAFGDGLPAGSGELVVRSPSVMMGYAQSAEDLAQGDVYAGELLTGDIATRDADGDFTIVGRTSRFIKLQGNRVNLADIEDRLATRGLSVACVGMDDHLWITTEHHDPELVRAAVLEEFTFPHRSTAVVRLDRLPRSDAGKILYRELLEALRVEG